MNSSKLKNRLKKFPFFYGVCRFIFNPGFRFYPSKRNKLLKKLLNDRAAKVLNIGSGYLKMPERVINTDIFSFKGVDLLSDAHHLPFGDGVFDGLLLESILEHVSDPDQVAKEAHRVLKKGGIIFVELPFVYELHQSPADYYRFTLPGLERVFADFKKIDCGIDVGPTGTLNAVLRNYFALIFSFGIPGLYEFLNLFLGVFLFPLKLLDFILIRFRYAQNISSAFYLIGEKQ